MSEAKVHGSLSKSQHRGGAKGKVRGSQTPSVTPSGNREYLYKMVFTG